MFEREGYPLLVGAAAIAALLFAIALRTRSWPLWLLGFVMTNVALGLAWYFGAPAMAQLAPA